MVYTQVIDGFLQTSNIPFDAPLQPGELVTVDIHLNTGVAQLAALGYDILTIFNLPTFEAALVAQNWQGAITNYNVYASDMQTITIAFIVPATAAAVVTQVTSAGTTTTVQPFLVGDIIVAVAIATAAIIIASNLGAFIAWLAHNVFPAVGTAVNFVGIIAGALLVVGAGAFIYDFLKSRDVRLETYRAIGRGSASTASAAAREAKHAVGATARYAVRTAPGAARFLVKTGKATRTRLEKVARQATKRRE